MKITLDIADDLVLCAKQIAKKQGVTLSSLLEKSLIAAIDQNTSNKVMVKPVTFLGKGRQKKLEAAFWPSLRDTIYNLKKV